MNSVEWNTQTDTHTHRQTHTHTHTHTQFYIYRLFIYERIRLHSSIVDLIWE